MKCPACSNELHEYKAGSYNVDICRDGCSGIWFDKDELVKCDEHNEPFPNELLRVRKQANVVIDWNKARKCPSCTDATLTKVVLDPEIRFEIDKCPKCEGNWLDIGELENIRRRQKEDSELDARLKSYEAQAEKHLKDLDKSFKISGLLRLILNA